MTKWRVLSTTDMVNWTDYGSPITLELFKWARDRAWASQCIERNGKFYWYICAQTTKNDMAIGVAVSDSPTGPFKDALGKPLITNGSWSNIGVLVSKAVIDFPEKANVKVNFESIGIKVQAKVRDLWSHKDLGTFNGSFSRELSQHGAGLFQITPLR